MLRTCVLLLRVKKGEENWCDLEGAKACCNNCRAPNKSFSRATQGSALPVNGRVTRTQAQLCELARKNCE